MAQPLNSQPRSHLQAALIALLILVPLGVYWPTLQAGFVQWDDDINIYFNTHIHGLSAANLHWMFTDASYVPRYMPLAWLGLGITYEISGLNPAGYHLGNVLFHCANTVLVFFLIQKLLLAGSNAAAPTSPPTRVTLCAALGALLWGIHPLRVEPVAWASGRIYGQASFFLLLSLLSYLRFSAAPKPGRRLAYGLSVLSFAASLFTYPLGLAYVVILAVLDWFPLRRFNPGWAGWWDAAARRIWLEKIPFAVVVTCALALTLWARLHTTGSFEAPVTLEQFPLFPRVMQAFYVWAYYLWKPWSPFDLSPLYTTLIAFRPASWPFVLSLVAVVAVSALLFYQRRRWPGVSALWICYLAFLVPVLGLTEHPHFPSDRYSYVVAIPWSAMISAGLLAWAAHPKVKAGAWAAGIVLAALLGTMSVRQTRVWHDSVSLFSYMITQLGHDPSRGGIHWRLGNVLMERGELNEAIAHYSAALEMLPRLAYAHDSLALALELQNKSHQALAHYESAARIQPTAERHLKLALALGRQGSNAVASAHYREALRLTPDLPEALNNLAWILATHGDATIRNGREAVELAERANLLTRYEKTVFVGTLAAAYAEAGRFADAITAAEKARGLAVASREDELAAMNLKLLELYRRGKPYREEPR